MKPLSVRARINIVSLLPLLLVAVLGLLYACTSSEPACAAIYTNLPGLLIAVAVALVVGILPALWLKSRLTTAIDALVDATRRIGKGERSICIPRNGRGDDELGELASAIERMAEQLHSREDEIRLAQITAENASRSKTLFLATMSHEIRTPLTAIIGYGDLLRDGTGDAAAQSEAAEAITRNSRHLLALINDTLDLAKVEAGMMTAESIPAVPEEIVRDVIAMVRQNAQDKGLKLELRLAAGLSDPITTDPTRLKQIILNLLSNAVKFTHTGSVTVCGEMVASQPPMLRISVQDTGIGMAADRVAELFKPFAQGDPSMTRRYGGTGLGLALAQHMARMLGGSILVESTPGAGSTFTLQVLAYPAAAQGGFPSLTAKNPKGLLSGARIIVVEDAIDTQRVLRLLLEHEGALVKTANNGQEAVDFLGSYKVPCVVLMDIQMPVLDGFQATQQLRERGFMFPVIAVTAQATREDRERCLEAGCNDFLPKPIHRDHLIQLLAGWVAHAATEQSAKHEEEELVVVAG